MFAGKGQQEYTLNQANHIHIHTHTHTYTYIYTCMYTEESRKAISALCFCDPILVTLASAAAAAAHVLLYMCMYELIVYSILVSCFLSFHWFAWISLNGKWEGVRVTVNDP